MAKDENVLQTLLRVKKVDGEKFDPLLYAVLSECDNKTDFIKNALFYYIININKGAVVDRLYPYNNEIEKYLPQTIQNPYMAYPSMISPSIVSDYSFSKKQEDEEFHYNESNSNNKSNSIEEDYENDDEEYDEDEYEDEYEDDEYDDYDEEENFNQLNNMNILFGT